MWILVKWIKSVELAILIKLLKFVIFLQIGDFCQIGLIGQIGQIDDLMSILVKFMIQYSTEIIYIMNMMKYRYNEIK